MLGRARLLLLLSLLAGCSSPPRGSDLTAYDPVLVHDGRSVQVPLVTPGNLQWCVRATVNGQPGLFALDTGADFTILSPGFAQRLGLLASAKRGRFIEGSSHSEPIRFVSITNLSLAALTYVGFYAPVLNLDHINRAMHSDLAGILGNNLLKKTTCTIDWSRSTLTLDPNDSRPPTNTIPIRIRENRIYLTVHVNGKPIEFALDTGAYRTLLAEKDLPRLGIPADRQSQAHPLEIDIAGTRRAAQTQVTLDSFKAGNLEQTNFPVLTWDHSVLGMDLLQNWILSFDARSGWMSLTALPKP